MKHNIQLIVLICGTFGLVSGCGIWNCFQTTQSDHSREPVYLWKANETVGTFLERVSRRTKPDYVLTKEMIPHLSLFRLENGSDFIAILLKQWDSFQTVISLRGPNSTIHYDLTPNEMEDFLEMHTFPPERSRRLCSDGLSVKLNPSDIRFNVYNSMDSWTGKEQSEKAICIVLSSNEYMSSVDCIIHQLQQFGMERAFFFYKIDLEGIAALGKMPFVVIPETDAAILHCSADLTTPDDLPE